MAIEVLPQVVVDQIAAGEMLERPAHLIKELTENSLDAGATRVDVEIQAGGRWIKVSDDGSGIASRELPLALSRFATSKLRSAEDLWHLDTFGFRGEALAAAGAVSNLKIISKADSSDGAQITSRFGILSSIEPTATEKGTTVIVDELFSNVPVREKFLKREGAEVAQIKRTLKALAATRPDVAFSLKTQGELVLHFVKKAQAVDRLSHVLGTAPLLESAGSSGAYQVQAFHSLPDNVTGNSQSLWFFVQNRWVQDRTIQAAVQEAYRNLLMTHEFPYVAIFLTAEPGAVDVNVHPTKSQVRFREPGVVFRLIQSTLRAGLERAAQKKPSSSNLEVKHGPQPPSTSEPTLFETSQSVDTTWNTFKSRSKDFANFNAGNSPRQELFEASVGTPVSVASTPAALFWSQLEVLGQAHQTYILAQSPRAFFMIDQHAAHERVRFERIVKSWKSSSNSLSTQKLLVPETVAVSPDTIEHFEREQESLLSWGLDIEPFGNESVIVRAHSAILDKNCIVPLVQKLSSFWEKNAAGTPLEDHMLELAATAACHSSVRAGQALSVAESKALLEQMDEFPFSSYCPHGRPVYLEFTFSQLEKDFGRRV